MRERCSTRQGLLQTVMVEARLRQDGRKAVHLNHSHMPKVVECDMSSAGGPCGLQFGSYFVDVLGSLRPRLDRLHPG
jgi:hypothetical protein